MVRFIHTADIHFDRDNRASALASLRTLERSVRDLNTDLVVIAGDLFNRGVQNASSSGLPELVSVMLGILDAAPVAVVEGTPTHDLPGCYDLFESLKARHSFAVVKKDVPFFLSRTADGSDLFTESQGERDLLLVLGCGEPSKDWFLPPESAEVPAQEISRAVETGLHGIFHRAADLRRLFHHLPCLFIYHGPVEGARLSAGNFAADHSLKAGKLDLAAVGADYYALGHIHLSQKLPGIPAWYPGSAYPVSWGETDAKGFSVVTLESKEPGAGTDGTGNPETRHVVVERKRYPHNPRKKLVTQYPERPAGVAGYQAWVEIRGTKDELSGIDPETERRTLLSLGALGGSRVTLSITPEGTVRAPRIREVRSLREKLSIYSDTSGIGFSEHVFEKAGELEREARSEGRVHPDASLRIRKLVLRGATGIWKGLRKDEIELDLDRYEQGILALSGRNGSGKTTLLENLHPYPLMITRSGSLASHFRLKDSFRELIFSDERSGVLYRSLILLDPTLAQPKAEYFLFRNGDSGWVSLTSGRLKDYEDAVTRLFGSFQLFLKSAFIPQRPSVRNPDLVEASPFERKSLFRELSGLEYLEEYAETARLRSKAFEEKAAEESIRITLLEKYRGEAESLRVQASGIEERLAGVSGKLALVTGEENRIAILLDELRKQAEEQRLRASRREDVEKRISAVEAERTGLEAQIMKVAEDVSCIPVLEEAAAVFRNLDARRQKLIEEKSRLLEEKSGLLQAGTEKERSLRTLELELEGDLAENRAAVSRLAREKASFETGIENLERTIGEKEAPLTETCPVCGGWLSAARLAELRAARQAELELLLGKRMSALEAFERCTDELAALVSEEEKLSQRLADLQAARESVREATSAGVRSIDSRIPEDALQETLHRIRAEGLAGAPERLSAARQAAALQAELGKRLAALEKERKLLRERREELGESSPDAAAAFDELRSRFEAVRKESRELQALEAGLVSERTLTGVRLEELEQSLKELEAARSRCEYYRLQAREWSALSSACGPDGIQALELDALSPSIAGAANRLLETAYGSRFRIEFRTTREAGRGAKSRTVEDFEIFVFDSRHGSEQALDTLSGGETVWIRKAIYDAFGIIRAENTGLTFLTVFQDEADGALDPVSRDHYFQMLEAAHTTSGRYQTIVITHSTEVREMIRQNIDMETLRERKRGISSAA